MTVQRMPYESIEGLLKRFKKITSKENLIDDMKRHQYYDKPSVKSKKKSIAARGRALKDQRKYE